MGIRRFIKPGLALAICLVAARAVLELPAFLAVLSIACITGAGVMAGRRITAKGGRETEDPASGMQARLEAAFRTRNKALQDAANELRRETSAHALTLCRLRETEEHLRLLADNTSDWHFSISDDLRFTYHSPSCESVTGYSSSEFINDPSLFLSIIHPGDREIMVDHLESPPAGNQTRSFDYRIIHRNGHIVWLNHTCRQAGGRSAGSSCLHARNRDITSRKLMEEQIRSPEQDPDHPPTPDSCTREGPADCVPPDLPLELKLAVEREEFVVFYQPLVNIESGRITAVEALVRWQHPTRGLLPPSAFMEEAENGGLIIPIGIAVLRKACAELARWDSLGMNPLRLCVNLSLRQLQDPSLPREIGRILGTTGIDPDRIELEINEHTAMSHGPEACGTMSILRSTGLHISLDNYGSGSSSLQELVRFPIDSVKIDRSFIHASTHSEQDAEAARGVINMARSLRLKVVAGGVERQDELAFLRREGCGDYQGFLFSPPVPAEDMERLLATAGDEGSREAA